jgi:hypothetical protein
MQCRCFQRSLWQNLFQQNMHSLMALQTQDFRGNCLYEVKETRVWGPDVISLHLMMGACQFYIVGCYIPPLDLTTLTCIKKAWSECPRGAHPIMVGNLNINLHAPHMERKETIAEQVEIMGLVDMSRHFCHHSGKRLRGRWTWQMRRGGRWISSQCDYFLGRETNCRRFRRISIQMPCYYSNHSIWLPLFTQRGGELKQYQRRMQ